MNLKRACIALSSSFMPRARAIDFIRLVSKKLCLFPSSAWWALSSAEWVSFDLILQKRKGVLTILVDYSGCGVSGNAKLVCNLLIRDSHLHNPMNWFFISVCIHEFLIKFWMHLQNFSYFGFSSWFGFVSFGEGLKKLPGHDGTRRYNTNANLVTYLLIKVVLRPLPR